MIGRHLNFIHNMAKCFTVVRSYSINIHRSWLASGRRSFTLDARKFSYEGPGKTTASFLDDEVGQYLMINSINDRGFKLTNGAFAVGPIILFPSFLFRVSIMILFIEQNKLYNIFFLILNIINMTCSGKLGLLKI